MLQFITHPSPRFSITEEVRLVLEGGCKWIQLRMKDASYDEMRATALEIIPLCKENDAIMVIDDNVRLTDELRVHGVHLGKNDMPPRQAREELGPHAIIGVTANTAEDILAMRGIDVDYVGLGPFRFTTTKSALSPVIGLDGYRDIMSAIRNAGSELPVVAIGGITLDDIDPLMETGINGVAMSGAIINAPDPKEYTAKVIEALNRYQ
ncbi:thiamine phosphate synthase [Muribaculum intestinale]|jgi:thiamine-phosphate pyrophosphorylase|uniref:Thiamine-phosphate synthase n=1 Tax=Muribaculum intestinale TaxID=1796646 RepID=A0A1B1SA64_9BACT|nr:thiamine phosphate synthase [Muribaculum intestinale]GFI66744.1 thiamine-phosphate synthase [Muribaculaceae bacterium]ANU63661.1 thiamine-phosphate diphosphorylase [Muribaculum intestinale]ASB38260.1 thiamine phosphate synthase [Muribaculum intestinale]PWB04558.1 thiamine phosphate synthase [Muribaculum intestinale]PWB11320.1 thiamine phosphate synthase [Muribaculum intestinale]